MVVLENNWIGIRWSGGVLRVRLGLTTAMSYCSASSGHNVLMYERWSEVCSRCEEGVVSVQELSERRWWRLEFKRASASCGLIVAPRRVQ